MQGIEEKRNLPSGGELRGHPAVYLGGQPDHAVADFRKKSGEFPPLDHPPGGKPALFSEIQREGSLGVGSSQNRVFRGGLPYNPCSRLLER